MQGAGYRSSLHPNPGRPPFTHTHHAGQGQEVDCTCVWLVFSNRSLASKRYRGAFTPYLVMALMKLPMFSSWRREPAEVRGWGGGGGRGRGWVEVGGATGGSGRGSRPES